MLLEAARREGGRRAGTRLDPVAVRLPAGHSSPLTTSLRGADWPASISEIPEHAFAFETGADPCLSTEHTDFAWLDYETAFELLRWDSNRSALWELQDRLLRADFASEDQGTT